MNIIMAATMCTRSLTYKACTCIIALILVFEDNAVSGVDFTRTKNCETRCGWLLCEQALTQNMEENVVLSLSLMRVGHPAAIVTMSKRNPVVKSNQINGIWYPKFASIHFNMEDEQDCKLTVFSCESLTMDNAGYTRKRVSTIWPPNQTTQAHTDILPDSPYTETGGKRYAKRIQVTGSNATISTVDTRTVYKRVSEPTSGSCVDTVGKIQQTVTTIQQELSQLIGKKSWTVIQRRTDMNVDMNKNWNDYISGFSQDGVYWMGLNKIHAITNIEPHEVMFVFTDIYTVKYAKYDTFSVRMTIAWYMFELGKFVDGNTSDGLWKQRKGYFGTSDKHIRQVAKCVKQQKSGWWYDWDGYCGGSNMNANDINVIWTGDTSIRYIGYTEIRIRPVKG